MKTIPTLLHEIPELAIEVQMTAGIGAPNPTVRPQIRRPQPGSRPPLDLGVIDLMRADPLEDLIIGAGDATSHLVDRLGMCVRMVAEERELAGLSMPEPQFGTFSGTCAYLASTSGWWLSEAGLSEDVSWETRKVWKALRSAANAPEEEEPPLKCPVLGCQDRTHLQPGGKWVLCPSGHQRDVEAEKMHFLGMQEWTLAQSRRKLEEHFAQKVPIKTMEAWVRRDKLKPVRHTRNGTAVYSFSAVMVLAKARRHAQSDDVADDREAM